MDTTSSGTVTTETALAALDCGVVPMLMLGRRARIVHPNRAATTLLAAGRAFTKVNGRLHVQRQADQEAIEAAVDAALDKAERTITHLTNRQGDINHIVTVSPLPGDELALAAIAELRLPVLLRRTWSREALSLPPGYAELAEALAGGENLTEFAERTGLTIGGARTRLKKLLKRLAARSQSDLIALLLRAASTISIR